MAASDPIQPPPSSLQGILGSAYKWLVDTINKITAVQMTTSTALSVVGITIRNNTPDGTDISWSACTVWYQDVPYAIAAGNTTGGQLLVWWNVGDAVFTSGNSFTPSPTRFPILTNVAGTADTTWQKVGASSIQSSQVIGGLLPPGYQVQPPATASQGSGAAVSLINFTGSGALLGFGLDLNGSIVTTGGMALSVNVDGSGAQIYPLTNGNGATNDTIDQAFNLTAASAGTNQWVTFFQTPFQTSLVVQLVFRSAGHWNSGQMNVAASWAKKV